MQTKQDHAVAAWLEQKLRSARAAHRLGAAGLLAVAAVVLLVTFALVYAALWLAFGWRTGSDEVVLWVSLVVLVLLFIGNATADRRELETLSVSAGTFHDRPVHIDIPLLGGGSTVNPLAPDSARSFVKLIASLLCTGPRLAAAAFGALSKVRRLGAVDVESCAGVLAFLAARDGRVPFAEVVPAVPRGHDVAAVLTQLQEIDGVMLLKSEPPGLSLESGLRTELRPHLPKRRKTRADA